MDIAFKHMDRSEAVENIARETFESILDKHGENPISFRALFSVNRKFKSVHISAHLRDGHQVELEQGEDNIYKAIELIGDRLGRELRKQKNKRISQRNKEALKNADFEMMSEE